jgi:hypothetical protein
VTAHSISPIQKADTSAGCTLTKGVDSQFSAMDAVLSVAEGHIDPEEYHLDLTADAGVEEFDFKLDDTLEDDGVEQSLADDAIEDEANGTGDFEIGYEDEEQVDQGEQGDSEHNNADE